MLMFFPRYYILPYLWFCWLQCRPIAIIKEVTWTCFFLENKKMYSFYLAQVSDCRAYL